MPLSGSHAAFANVGELLAPGTIGTVRESVGAENGRSVQWTVVNTRKAFDALRTDWEALFQRAGRPEHVFQTFSWYWHWCNHYLDDTSGRTRLAIITARRDQDLVFVWPLLLETGHLLRTLSWMGDPVSQYGDVLIDDVPDRLMLLREARDLIRSEINPDVIVLRKVRADAMVAPFLAEAGATVTSTAEAPFLELSNAPDFEAYYSRHSTKARRNHRRLARRLEELGAVTYQSHGEGDRAREVARAGIAMKRRWLHDRGLLSPAFLDERLDRFFADVAAGRSGHSTGARVFSIDVDGAPAAIQLAFQCKGRLALHVMTYRLEFEKRGVGVLNLLETVRRSFDLGCSTIDLLAPRADYKMDWASGTTVVSDYAIPLTTKGRLYTRLLLAEAKPRLKALIEALPLRVRRMLARKAAKSTEA